MTKTEFIQVPRGVIEDAIRKIDEIIERIPKE